MLSKIVMIAAIAGSLLMANGEKSETLSVDFFGSATCGDCMTIKAKLLASLENEFADKFSYNFYDIETDSGLAKLISNEKALNIMSSSSQMLFFPDTFLSGFDDIMKYGRLMIESRIKSGSYNKIISQNKDNTTNLSEVLRSKAMDWGFLVGTIVAGLADGVNPCAIATMIFLISFMATRKRSRTQILLIGLTYTATVFFTYFAMGLGLKSVLEGIQQYHVISQIIRWSAFAAAIIIAILSFKDAFVFSKTQQTKEITLQLPKKVKLLIHKIISGNLSGTSLIIGAIVTGFFVTLLEAICTGQMYVPFIIAMTGQQSLRLTGYLYLILYNFLFVLPLLIVMVLAYYGMKWNELAKKTQDNMVKLKIILGVVMTALAVYLLSGLL